MKKLMIVCAAVAVACVVFGAKPKTVKIEMPLPKGAKVIDVGADKELKTLEDALDHVKELRKTDKTTPIAFRVAPGDYAPAKPLVITKEHASTNMAQLVVYAADFAQKPRIHGGTPITGWAKTKFNDRDDVWVADVSKIKLTNNPKETPRPRLLFFNGTRMQAARFPNLDKKKPFSTGFAYARQDKTPGAKFYENELFMATNDVRVWKHPEDGSATIHPEHNYWSRFHEVVAMTNGVIYLKAKHNELHGYNRHDRYCVENIAEELDQPGEWYFDPRARKVYVITPDGSDPNKTVVAFPKSEPIVTVRGAGNCTFAGLELTSGTDGFRIINGSAGVDVIACHIHDLGGNGFGGCHASCGVFVMATDVKVTDCDIHNIGNHGVMVHGYGCNGPDDRQNVVVENNYIHHCGEVDPAGQGVRNSGQGVRVSHNLMHDFPRSAICGYGRFSETSYNRIRHMNQTADDTGALYDAAWTSCVGSKICYNWISDSIGYKRQPDGSYTFYEGATGIYFDECSGGVEVFGNRIENCSMGVMHLHNARWITITNNVFVSGGKRNPMSRWTFQFSLQPWSKAAFNKGRIGYYGGEHNNLVKTHPDWVKYPALAQNPKTDEVFSNDKYGTMMMGVKVEKNIFYFPEQGNWIYMSAPGVNPATNSINRNVIWPGVAWAGATNIMHVRHDRIMEIHSVKKEDRGPDWDPFARDTWEEWKASGFDRDSLVADPLFVNANMKDYRLKSDSPAFKMGFVELPYEKIGLQKTHFRPVLPVEAEGLREHPEWLELNDRWMK